MQWNLFLPCFLLASGGLVRIGVAQDSNATSLTDQVVGQNAGSPPNSGASESGNVNCSCRDVPIDQGTITCDCPSRVDLEPGGSGTGESVASGDTQEPPPRTRALNKGPATIPVPPAPDVLSIVDPFCIRLPPLSWFLTQPTFHVFTKTKQDQFKVFSTSSVQYYVKKLDENGYFAKNRQIIFVVHGFFGNACPMWMYDVKSKIIAAEDSTVLMVNWQLGADNPGYGIAASTTQTVSDIIRAVAEAILNQNTFRGKKVGAYFYCVGHSLGAQICGQAGRKARTSTNTQLFDRVTALDPAGPGFERCSDRLHVDKDSAPCVDVVHTDGSLNGHLTPLFHLGTMLQWGHIDFYANGGSAQPSCALGLNDIGCSHNAALDYFVSTISDPSICKAIGPCYNGNNIAGSCTSRTQNMGYWSTCHRSNLAWRTEGIFYVPMTATKNPKCTASKLMGCISTDGAFFTIKSSLLGNVLLSGGSFQLSQILNTSNVLTNVVPDLSNVPVSSVPKLPSGPLPSVPNVPSLGSLASIG